MEDCTPRPYASSDEDFEMVPDANGAKDTLTLTAAAELSHVASTNARATLNCNITAAASEGKRRPDVDAFRGPDDDSFRGSDDDADDDSFRDSFDHAVAAAFVAADDAHSRALSGAVVDPELRAVFESVIESELCAKWGSPCQCFRVLFVEVLRAATSGGGAEVLRRRGGDERRRRGRSAPRQAGAPRRGKSFPTKTFCGKSA